MKSGFTHEFVAIDRIEARLEPFDWDFARERRAEIDAHWHRLIRGKPGMFNGKVLIQTQGALEADVYRARYGVVDYAAFLAWRDFGYPPSGEVRNGFAMAALQANDGAFLLGVMGAGTANAGQIYFPAGTPDLADVTEEGEVDLAGNILRELVEETGLRAEEVTVGQSWTALLHPARIAFMRDVVIDLPAQEARDMIVARIKAQAAPELADIVIARSLADIDADRLPAFMRDFLAARFALAQEAG